MPIQIRKSILYCSLFATSHAAFMTYRISSVPLLAPWGKFLLSGHLVTFRCPLCHRCCQTSCYSVYSERNRRQTNLFGGVRYHSSHVFNFTPSKSFCNLVQHGVDVIVSRFTPAYLPFPFTEETEAKVSGKINRVKLNSHRYHQ